jgi:hypothetical protein
VSFHVVGSVRSKGEIGQIWPAPRIARETFHRPDEGTGIFPGVYRERFAGHHTQKSRRGERWRKEATPEDLTSEARLPKIAEP